MAMHCLGKRVSTTRSSSKGRITLENKAFQDPWLPRPNGFEPITIAQPRYHDLLVADLFITMVSAILIWPKMSFGVGYFCNENCPLWVLICLMMSKIEISMGRVNALPNQTIEQLWRIKKMRVLQILTA